MDSVNILLLGIAGLGLVLLLTLFLFLFYSGLLHAVTVGAGPPPIAGFTVAYKFLRGPYKNVSSTFTEAASIVDKRLKAFGVYYDDPREVAADDLRAAVGCILSEGETGADPKVIEAFQRKDYRLFSFPAITSAVCSSFPYTTQLSIILANVKVYPALSNYIEEHKLCTHPFMEIYDGQLINFVIPLAKQDDFYVPDTEGHKSKNEWKSSVENDTSSKLDKETKVTKTDKDKSDVERKED